MDQRGPLDDQGEGRREVAELVVVVQSGLGVIHAAGLTRRGHRIRRARQARNDGRPVLGVADQLLDGLDQDLFLPATLEAELATEVAELTELTPEYPLQTALAKVVSALA